MTHRYVYGVVEGDLEFEPDGGAVGGGDRVYTVSHRRLGAVVSTVETTEPAETDEDARRHDDVLREVRERVDGAVVPFQFGMVFENDRALKNVLRNARSLFRRTLRDVEGRVELGLKLVIEEGSDVDRNAVTESVAGRLEPLAADAVENDHFSDRLVLNRSYLVEEDDQAAFGDAIDAIDAEYDELLVQYTGPFAPYSFVDVTIGAR